MKTARQLRAEWFRQMRRLLGAVGDDERTLIQRRIDLARQGLTIDDCRLTIENRRKANRK